MSRARIIILIWLLVCSQAYASDREQDASQDVARRTRRPIALAISADSNWLYTANRSSGSVSVIDITGRSVAAEIDIGGQLADVVVIPGGLLVLDRQNHQLVLLTGDRDEWRVASRLNVARDPVRIELDREAQRGFVSSLWSQSVTMIDLSQVDREEEPELRVLATLRLPFEPRELCLIPGKTRLIVAGAFQSRLATIDTSELKLVGLGETPGQNIRGLAIDANGQRVFATQQELNPIGRSTRDDVHWGNMLSNLLISWPLDTLCDAQGDLLQHRVVHHLGEPGKAAGDPGPIRFGLEGEICIVLSGVNEVAIGGDNAGGRFRRVPVGRRPVASEVSPDGLLFLANQFSDSVSIVDVTRAEQVGRVSLGPQPEPSLAERGEMLFFDSRLSHDGWMSCHSCHTDGHFSGQLNDNLSDGSFGAPKRVLSLLGVGQTGPWAWTGEVSTLEEQVSNSINKTMQGAAPTADQIGALVAYLTTLPAPSAPSNLAANRTAGRIQQGQQLFHALDCQRCHAPPTYTSPQTYDVGLTDAAGNKRFNPPSLRGVGRRQSLFHDARASLTDVLTKHKHQLSRELSEAELKSLLEFLRSI